MLNIENRIVALQIWDTVRKKKKNKHKDLIMRISNDFSRLVKKGLF
jgi:hypothetical protein